MSSADAVKKGGLCSARLLVDDNDGETLPLLIFPMIMSTEERSSFLVG